MDEKALRALALAQSISADDVAAFLAWLHPADPAQALGHSVRPFGDVQPAPVQAADESEPPCGDLFRKMPQLRQCQCNPHLW